MKCPNCDFESPPNHRFCGMCGASLVIDCQECQSVNPITYRFCGMCGTPLLGEYPPRTTPQPRFTTQTTGAQAQASHIAGLSSENSPVQQPVSPPGAMVPLYGERRVASVIFVDVKGSTELLERIGTEAWVEVMNSVFQVLETEIYRFRGEVNQFRGDGLVALFGARTASEDDTEHAVLAALAMQEAMKSLENGLLSRFGAELVLRVGVNTGEVIVANVGDRQYSEDTAMGEALTIASRMESAAEPGTVLVSENTYRLVREQFDWLPLGQIMVKGISHEIPVYRPLAARQNVESSQDNQQEAQSVDLVHGLIGRKAEITSIKKCIEELHVGRGGIVLVTGMKGMGKSYVVMQVRQHFARQNVLLAAVQNKEKEVGNKKTRPDTSSSTPVQWLRGRCRSYNQLRPYSMWLDLMHDWLGTNPEGQSTEVLSVLRAQMETQWGSDVEKDYPNLATFLSSSSDETSTERARHLDAEGLKRQFFQTVRDWIRNLARTSPIVIGFADMQWADTTSLELLEYVLPLCDTEPIVWLMVYREERDSPIWEFQHRLETLYPHRLTHVNIPPLSKNEIEEFIIQLLGSDVLRSETQELIIKKSEGNPYFIKELIHSLIIQGALTRDTDRGEWKQEREVNYLDLPDSLQSLLMARIDRLSPGERRTLQMAAVVGSVFWMNALLSLAGTNISPQRVQADLVALQRAGLVIERAYVEDLGMEYVFDSHLIREVAYESLLNQQRISYHLLVAEFLEEIVFREGKRGYFNTLAHHYRLAGDVKKELFYTLQAADRAQSIYANSEALHYFSRALELLDQIEQQSSPNGHQRYAILTQKFEALNGRRAVHFLMGNLEEGWEDARALLPLARQLEQDPTWLVDALLQQPGVSSADSREELIAGVPLAQEALEYARKVGDKRREMNCLLAIASQRNLLNDPTWVKVGDDALTLAREIGDRQYEAMILLALGHSYVGRDELQRGMDYLNAALPICKELDDKITELTLLQVLGAQFERSGDHFKRLSEFEMKRLEIARDIGDRFEEGNALMFCGQIQALNLGDYQGGLQLLRNALEIFDAVSSKIFTLLRIAQVQIELGQYEEAQLTIETARPVAERNVYDLSRVGLKLVMILLFRALGDTTHLNLALETAEEIIEMENSQLVSRQYRMAAACEAGAAHLTLAQRTSSESERRINTAKALEHTQIAVDTFESFGYVNIVECTCEDIYFRHSQALAANGFIVEAGEYLEKAYDEMVRKYEMIPSDSPYRRTYLENIASHREIRAAHTAALMAKASPSGNKTDHKTKGEIQ